VFPWQIPKMGMASQKELGGKQGTLPSVPKIELPRPQWDVGLFRVNTLNGRWGTPESPKS
jgi:hypothetical protein